MLNHACTILEQDFREVLFSKLRQGFPSGFDLTQAYNYVQSTFTQGRIQSTDAETEKSRAAFLVSEKSHFSSFCTLEYSALYTVHVNLLFKKGLIEILCMIRF